MAEADALRAELPKTKILGTSAVNKVIQDLQKRIFSVGGYDTIMKVVEGLFSRPLMKQVESPPHHHHHKRHSRSTVFCSAFTFVLKVLPEDLRSRLPDKDDEARNDIVATAKGFLTEIMATNGRRPDLQANAFWAAAVALIPGDVVLNRKGRAIHRLLGVGPRVIAKATQMRKELIDRSQRWILVTTASHSDASPWHVLDEWLHSDEASHEDNTRKELVRVDRIDLAREGEPKLPYELHRARVLNDTKSALFVKFKGSQAFAQMAADFLAKKKARRLKLATIRARVNTRRSAAAAGAGGHSEVSSSCSTLFHFCRK